MPITITGVSPVSVALRRPRCSCRERSARAGVVVTTSCSTKPVTVAIPTGGPNTWNAVLPNDKQCPCGATVDVTATCAVGKKDSDKGTYTIVCDTLGSCFDSADDIYGSDTCVTSLSKDVHGETALQTSTKHLCAQSGCVTLRTRGVLKLALANNAPCDHWSQGSWRVARRPHPRDRVREGRPRARSSRRRLQVGHGQEGRDRRNHLRDHQRRPVPPGAVPGRAREVRLRGDPHRPTVRRRGQDPEPGAERSPGRRHVPPPRGHDPQGRDRPRRRRHAGGGTDHALLNPVTRAARPEPGRSGSTRAVSFATTRRQPSAPIAAFRRRDRHARARLTAAHLREPKEGANGGNLVSSVKRAARRSRAAMRERTNGIRTRDTWLGNRARR